MSFHVTCEFSVLKTERCFIGFKINRRRRFPSLRLWWRRTLTIWMRKRTLEFCFIFRGGIPTPWSTFAKRFRLIQTCPRFRGCLDYANIGSGSLMLLGTISARGHDVITTKITWNREIANK